MVHPKSTKVLVRSIAYTIRNYRGISSMLKQGLFLVLQVCAHTKAIQQEIEHCVRSIQIPVVIEKDILLMKEVHNDE